MGRKKEKGRAGRSGRGEISEKESTLIEMEGEKGTNWKMNESEAIRTPAFELEELNLKCQGCTPPPHRRMYPPAPHTHAPPLRSPCCAVVWIKIIKQALF